MSVTPTICPVSIAWNSLTWSATNTGGPLGFRYMHEGNEQESRTGDDEYPQAVFIVDKSLRVFVTLADVKQTLTPGTKDDMVVTIKTASGTQAINLANMVLTGFNGNQPRAVVGENELAFVHESADGQTSPVT